MVSINSIRALILKKEFTAKDILLSDGEIEVVERANIKPITSSDVSSFQGVSSQQACNVLKRLMTKGYLESKTIRVPGSNPYQIYSIPKPLRKLL